MVSSEAESDGSVLSEPPRHDATDLSHSDITADQQTDRMLGTAPDVRAVGTALASLVSTRGTISVIITIVPILNHTVRACEGDARRRTRLTCNHRSKKY